MNFCLWYAVIWIFVLVLYGLQWSDLNAPLTPGLLAFFLITIIVSLILGFANRKRFKFLEIPKLGKPYKSMIVPIVLGFMAEMIYSRQVPLIAIALGRSQYTEFTGFPVFHVLLLTYACYYGLCAACRYRGTGDKKHLYEFLVIVLLYLLIFSRASLIVLAFCFICVMISGNNLFVRHTKTILYLIPLLFIIITYAFGILGNIRCGCAWNDCTVINEIGQYNARYPAWLPDEFKWAYTYITSPLANLNNGILTNGVNLSAGNYFKSFVPDFLSKRLFPGFRDNLPEFRSIADLNAIVGLYSYYYYGGLWGALGAFAWLVVCPTLLFRFHFFSNYDDYFPALLVCNFLAVFVFFWDVIYLSQCSFILVYPILFSLFGRRKSKLDPRNILMRNWR